MVLCSSCKGPSFHRLDGVSAGIGALIGATFVHVLQSGNSSVEPYSISVEETSVFSSASNSKRYTENLCPNRSYVLIQRLWNSTHGDICQNLLNASDWTCPRGCEDASWKSLQSRGKKFRTDSVRTCIRSTTDCVSIIQQPVNNIQLWCQCHIATKQGVNSVHDIDLPLKWRKPLAVPRAGIPEVTPIAAQKCLERRWIYCIGDSSMRMYFKALLELLAPGMSDSRFGSYKKLDKGGCSGGIPDKTIKGGLRGEEEYGETGGGCLREYFDHKHGIRVTFSFKTFARQNMKAEEWLVTSTQVPDLILTATGAWDLTYRKSMKKATVAEASIEASTAAAWIRHLAAMYPTTSILTMTLNTCHKEFQLIAQSWNAAFLKENLGSIENVAVLNREIETAAYIGNKSLCEGWHAYDSIVMHQVYASLRGICR